MLKKISDPKNCTPKLLKDAENNYSFQIELTKQLDAKTGDFDQITLLKIILWKTNRYPKIESDTLHIVNELRKNYSVDKAKKALTHLLKLKGFDLPMASTLLRFACPSHLQIIDKRVFRLIMPQNHLKIPHNTEEKVKLYFEYISHLKMISKKYSISFKKADRILYQLDKHLNSKIPIGY